MNKSTLALLTAACGALLAGCQPSSETQEAAAAAPEAPASPAISIKNSSGTAVTQVPVLFDKATLLEQGLSDISSSMAVLMDGEPVAYQFDDLDADGEWDQLAVLADMQSGQAASLSFAPTGASATALPLKTNIRIGQYADENDKSMAKEHLALSRKSAGLPEGYARQYQMEGPAWENDKVGFRLYFDERNGFDIFGKSTSELVLDRVGINENYHELQPWGMDVLKVGRSLGAGGVSYFGEDNQPVRLSQAEQTDVSVLVEGPIRSVFDIKYSQIQLGSQTVDMTHRIEIWAGQDFYRSTIMADNLTSPVTLGVGLVNFKELTPVVTQVADSTIVKTFGKQGELDSNLGMAIRADSSDFVEQTAVGATEEGIEKTVIVKLQLQPGEALTYDIYAVWEPGNGSVGTAEAFTALLTESATKLAALSGE